VQGTTPLGNGVPQEAHAVGALSVILMAKPCSFLANNSACNQPEKVSAAPAFGGSAKAPRSSAPFTSENGDDLFSTTQGAVMRSIVNADKSGRIAQ